MSHLIVCSECNKHLQVPDELIGKTVQCPECKHTFTAAVDEPRPIKPLPPPLAEDTEEKFVHENKKSRRRKDDDDDDDNQDDEDDDDRPRSRRTRRGGGPDFKPGKVQGLGIMMLIGGIFAILLSLSIGGATFGWCCLWPGTYYSLILGIMAIVRGSSILGSSAHLQTPPTGIAIMQIINIINGDVVNLTLGIIAMVFCNDEEVQEFMAPAK